MIAKRYLSILCLAERRFPTTQSFLGEVLAKIIPARGHLVRWIMQSEAPQKGIRRVRWHGSSVVVLPARRRRSLPGKVIDWTLRTIDTIRWFNILVRANRPDVVQVRNDWVPGLWAVRIKRKYGIPFVFQFSRPGPDFQFQKALNAPRLLRPVLYLRGHLERQLIHGIMKQADHILPVSEWMKTALAERGIPEGRMTAFPLGFNTEIAPDETSGQGIRERFGLGRDPVILYFGDLARLRKLDFLLRVMGRIVQTIPQAKLLIVGGSERSRDILNLQNEARRMGLNPNVIFTGKVPREEIPHIVVASDVGVSPIPPLPIYWISSPTKLIETMGMARPSIANDIPDQRKVLEESGGGICVPYEEGPFAEAVIRLLSSPEEARRMGRAGREYVERVRSYARMAEKLEALYFSLLA